MPKRPLQTITTNLAPNNVEILYLKKKMLLFGDSYTRTIRYSEKISTLGISGANSGNLIQKLVEAGAKLLSSSETAKIGTIFFIKHHRGIALKIHPSLACLFKVISLREEGPILSK